MGKKIVDALERGISEIQCSSLHIQTLKGYSHDACQSPWTERPMLENLLGGDEVIVELS